MTDFTELLSVLAHEMRTPISAILGYQELLREGIYGPISERGKEPLDRIAYSARQLLHLIDGVQEIGTPETKRLNTQPVHFEPAPVLRTCIENAHADAVGRSVVLEDGVADNLPRLWGDPDRFCRAIDLTLAAAIKTSNGAIIRVAAEADGTAVDIRVSDTGLEPSRDNPDFARPNGSRPTGAGLRLAIVREIARRMHGSLELRPTPSGTTVLLHFESAEN